MVENKNCEEHKGFFQTKITELNDKEIWVRGYPLREMIGNMTYSECVFLTFLNRLPKKNEAKMFDAVLSSMMSYTARAPNMLVGRFLVSVNPQVTLGLAASLCCAGPSTISPQDSAEMIEETLRSIEQGEISLEQAARQVVEPYIKNRQFLPGLGHPDFKETDPRTARLWELASRWGFLGEKVATYEAIRKAYLKGIGRKHLPINIDGAMACILSELGFNPHQMVCISLFSLMPGIAAHMVEEITEGRRFRMLPEEMENYIGPERRHLPDNKIVEPLAKPVENEKG